MSTKQLNARKGKPKKLKNANKSNKIFAPNDLNASRDDDTKIPNKRIVSSETQKGSDNSKFPKMKQKQSELAQKHKDNKEKEETQKKKPKEKTKKIQHYQKTSDEKEENHEIFFTFEEDPIRIQREKYSRMRPDRSPSLSPPPDKDPHLQGKGKGQ